MNTPNQNPVEPIQAQDNIHRDREIAQDETRPAAGSLSEPQIPPPPSEDDKSSNRRRKIANLRKAGVFWLEIGTFIALIAYATITKNQWRESIIATDAATSAAQTASDTLAELKKGSTDTHELAVQAKNQADRTKDVADRALLQANATNRLANAAQTQASGTKESVAVARDTLIANARPWMNAEIHISGPLTFDKTGAIYLPVVYALENTGHSPAINVWSQVELYLPHNPQIDTQIERERACGQAAEGSKMNGQTVFPGGAHPVGEVDTALNNEAVQKGQIFKDFINPTIIVCIAYQSTLEKNIWHYTGLTFDIHEMSPTGGMVAIQIGKDVPLDRLKFSLSFFRGVVAN